MPTAPQRSAATPSAPDGLGVRIRSLRIASIRIASSSTAAVTAASSRLSRSALFGVRTSVFHGASGRSKVVDASRVAGQHLNPCRDRLVVAEYPPIDELAEGAGERFTMHGGADEIDLWQA